jgi:protein ImuB
MALKVMKHKLPLSSLPRENLPDEQSSSGKIESEQKRNELWLAVHLPNLALEVVKEDERSGPLVIVEQLNSRQFVHSASDLAERSGVVTGMSLNAAYAVCCDLQAQPVDHFAQQQRLQQLVRWALQYSPRISLQSPCSFVLEVGASIQYFGGLDLIQQDLTTALTNKWQHQHHIAITPSATASLLLARSGNEVVVNNIAGLRSTLGSLPVSLLPLDEKRIRQLTKIGVRVLRDLWRLPPADLMQRFGTDLVYYLERVLGKSPDPLITYLPPPRFEASHDLGYEVHNYQPLLPFAHELLDELSEFLKKQDVYAGKFTFYFQYEQHIPTVINIDLRQALRDSKHFLLLLETKMNQLVLPAPVIAIKLIAETLYAYSTQTTELFQCGDHQADGGGDIEDLLEQLYARLGHKAIAGITAREDHRPEHAHHVSEPGFSKYSEITAARPFWLLPCPRQLLERNNRLYYKSIIHFSMGPERIETGWWDCDDICRDYYIGVDEIAGSLWIFHDLKDRQSWYLHGLFG